MPGYPYAFAVGSILAKRRACTHGRILRYTKYGLWTRQIKVTGQRKTGRNASCKWFKPPQGHNSGTVPLSLPVCLSIQTVLFSLLINTLFASLISVFVEMLFCKTQWLGPLSLISGLVISIWCFYHHHDPVSAYGNPNPPPICCRPRPP